MRENIWIEELSDLEVNYDFKTLLSKLSQKELTEIGELWGFQGISDLNKAELIDELSLKIRANLESWILILGVEQSEFLEGIAAFCDRYTGIYLEQNEQVYQAAAYFKARGIVFCGKDEDGIFFLIPEEIRTKISSILNKKSVQKQISLNDNYIRYAAGSAVYYGVLTPELLASSLERHLKIEGEIEPLEVVLEYSRYSHIYDSLGQFFIFEFAKDILHILKERESHSDLDYYLPSKSELENAYQKNHENWNSVQQSFKKKLIRDYRLPAAEAETLTSYFSLMIKNDSDSAEIIPILAEEFEIRVSAAETDFRQLINDFQKHTRLWTLKGHTPAEVDA
ncbi:MAG: hypothetical protein ACQERL_10965 [Bacillota bacterium]